MNVTLNIAGNWWAEKKALALLLLGTYSKSWLLFLSFETFSSYETLLYLWHRKWYMTAKFLWEYHKYMTNQQISIKTTITHSIYLPILKHLLYFRVEFSFKKECDLKMGGPERHFLFEIIELDSSKLYILQGQYIPLSLKWWLLVPWSNFTHSLLHKVLRMNNQPLALYFRVAFVFICMSMHMLVHGWTDGRVGCNKPITYLSFFTTCCTLLIQANKSSCLSGQMKFQMDLIAIAACLL